MKREPIRDYRPPSYPTRDAVSDETVIRWMPGRWSRSGKVAAGMAILFAAAPGVRADVPVPARPRGAKGDTGTPPDGVKKKTVNIQSVFEHGEGRGSFGCVAVAPPAFLSESDARQIILEEFARVGVRFALKSKTVSGLRRRQAVETWRRTDDGELQRQTGEKDLGPLTIDGYDAAHNIGFEYISQSDYFELGGPRSGSTVQSFDFVPIAKRLSDEAKRDGTVRLGVFYDPMARVDWEETDDGNYREPRNERGRNQLRAQVRDFIAFLRAEKVL